MGIHLEIAILSLGILLFSAVADPGNDYCSSSSTSSFFCGNNSNNINPPVRFPFKFLNQTRKECGYPGFDLGCNFLGIITLNLTDSGEFYVRHINYLTQQIQLYDPQDCLPGRLLNFNFSSTTSTNSPFLGGAYYNTYTFLGCPPDLDRTLFPVIGCLSNNTISVVATSSPDSARTMIISRCSVIQTVAVPRDDDIGIGLSPDLRTQDLFLSWNEPDCRTCEEGGGSCGFYDGEIVCSTPPPPPSNGWKPGEKFLKVVGFSVFLPFVILPLLFASIVCCRFLLVREQQLHLLRASNGAGATINSPHPAPAAFRFSEIMIPQLMASTSTSTTAKAAGLDDSVIESYPKVILDESCSNIVGGSKQDLICWICLDEYRPGDTLRCLPICTHFFHIQCIDKWLKTNGTCPVCRT